MSTLRNQTISKDNLTNYSVQQKTFQMIQTFLKKFPHILIRQQQFEQHLNKFRLKLYDDIFDEFKQQQRLAIVTLEKKVSCIKTNIQDNHRSTNRWNKINPPIFQSTQNNETTKNYTELKFNSIEPNQQQQHNLQLLRKQTIQSPNGMSSKGYDQLKETIQGVKSEMGSMKQKLGFLSAYMSQMESQQMNKQKIKNLKREVMDSVESKVEEQIREKMIETQKVVIQHINKLVLRFSDQLMDNVNAKNQKLQQEITKLTIKQTETSKKQLKYDIQLLSKQSIKLFSLKEETHQNYQLLDKKINNLHQRMKQLLQKSSKDKQQTQYLSQLLKVNSPNSRQLEISRMTTKSQHQWTKSNNLNSSMFMDNEFRGKKKQKQNIQTKNHPLVQQLTAGSLTTSQVSKEFMKDFGLSKKKIVKSNFQSSKKSSVYQKGKSYDEKVTVKPIFATSQNNEFSSL